MHKRNVELQSNCELSGDPTRILGESFLKLCESIDSPRSLSASILFRSGEHEQLLNLECNPDWYSSADLFADDYLVVSFLSKYPFLNVPFDPEDVAVEKFKEFEELCRLTNKRFLDLELDPSKWDPLLRTVFYSAKRKIARVLGDLKLDEISQLFGWGPGATSASKNQSTTAYDKFKSRLDVTSNSLVMAHCCVNSTPSWVNCQLQTDSFPSVEVSLTREAFNVVRGNEIVFVPKNAKTHRVIAIEPHVNSYLQKGFGSYIRRRLRSSANIDLDDQTINQRLAKLGSMSGSLATIDLSGASDSISKELVRFLLPYQWFVVLDLCRSKQGFLKKESVWLHYNKFSSMGNGYTFELESLIFWALAKASAQLSDDDSELSVYGDDIIVGTATVPLLATVIDFAGFRVNHKKSFFSGWFRESCGKDYFNGIEVRPIFLKQKVSSAESIFKLANGIRRYAHSRRFNDGCDRRFLPLWDSLLDWLHPNLRKLKISEGYGDCGLIVNFDEATPSRPGLGWDGWLFKALTHVPLKKRMSDVHAGYTAVLSSIGAEMPMLGFATPRSRTYRKVARHCTFEWYNLGAWN